MDIHSDDYVVWFYSNNALQPFRCTAWSTQEAIEMCKKEHGDVLIESVRLS